MVPADQLKVQFFFRSMCIGVLARAALICATYKRAMHLTVKSRAMHPFVCRDETVYPKAHQTPVTATANS